VCQATALLADTPHSRAGSLPQFSSEHYDEAAQHVTDSPEAIKTISGRGRTPQSALQSDPHK
jgi:hypothetical protein